MNEITLSSLPPTSPGLASSLLHTLLLLIITLQPQPLDYYDQYSLYISSSSTPVASRESLEALNQRVP